MNWFWNIHDGGCLAILMPEVCKNTLTKKKEEPIIFFISLSTKAEMANSFQFPPINIEQKYYPSKSSLHQISFVWHPKHPEKPTTVYAKTCIANYVGLNFSRSRERTKCSPLLSVSNSDTIRWPHESTLPRIKESLPAYDTAGRKMTRSFKEDDNSYDDDDVDDGISS